MRIKVWMLVLAMGMNARAIVVSAQNGQNGQNNGQPMANSATAPIGGVGADHGQGMNGAMNGAGPLKISFGKKSSQWTPATLAALPHKTITVYNEHAKASQTYTGVELMDLLTPLGVDPKPHGKDFRLYLVAEGSDGYQVAYSIGEVSPDVHDGTVMVADTLDGKPLGDNGPVQLVTTGEKRPARWVRNLVAIRVKTAD
ncbi:MAG: hypothetical protein ABSF53_20635 [Terracidiphilus sp.]|jgi:hypothetical protein